MAAEDTLATPSSAHVAFAIVGAVTGLFASIVAWPVSCAVVLAVGIALIFTRRSRGLGAGLLAGTASLWLAVVVLLPWVFEYRYPGVD